VTRSLLALLALLATTAVRADDSPMMGGKPDRNMVSGEKGLPLEFDSKSKKNIKWTAALGRTTYGTPVISGGRIFVGTNNDQPRDPTVKGDRGVLMCFAEADGKFLWQAVHKKLETGEAEDYPSIGIASGPCVVGDQVFYVSNRDELVCCSAVNGKAMWSLDMRKELGVSPFQGSASSPLVVGELVFVVTGQGRDHKKNKVLNPKAPSFIAVDKATGKVKWQDSSPGEKIFQGQWGSPSYGVIDGRAQVIFPGGDGWLYSFDPPSGKLLWKFNCKAHEKLDAEGNPETAAQLLACPVIVGHRVIIATGIDTDNDNPGCLRAIDARKSGDVTATAELWKVAGDQFGASISNVAVQDGLVYAVQFKGLADCYELETGKRVWQHDLLALSWGSPLLADGKLYIRTGDDEVVVLQAGREKKLLAKREVELIQCGSFAAANGVLYIAGKNTLYAIAEAK